MPKAIRLHHPTGTKGLLMDDIPLAEPPENVCPAQEVAALFCELPWWGGAF